MRVSRPNIAPPLAAETPGDMHHRPGATLSAGSQTVLPTVRFSPATTVSITAAANTTIDAMLETLDAVQFAESKAENFD
jgi:hypothetical protein